MLGAFREEAIPERNRAEQMVQSLVHRRYVDGRHGQLHLYLAGSQKDAARRPLVCFHMSPFSGRMFESLLAHMGTDRFALAPDTPGYGLSDPPPAPLSIPDYAAALGDAADALDLGEIDIMGVHTGSRIAVEFALQRPTQVKHLVLLGCAIYTEEERASQKRWTRDTLKPLADGDGTHLLSVWNSWARWRWPGVTDAMIERWMADALIDRVRGNWAMQAALEHDLMSRLPLLGQPVLILNAADDIYEPTKRAWRYLRKASLVDLAPAGLWYLDVKPAEAAKLIRAFVDEDLKSGRPSMR